MAGLRKQIHMLIWGRGHGLDQEVHNRCPVYIAILAVLVLFESNYY
jgi:hypothetical protein